MADAREPNKAGHPPTEPVFQDRGQDGPGITDPRSVKADVGQGLPPVRKQPARSGSAMWAAIVTSALLSLIFGAAGAWAYERYLAQLIAERFPAASTTQGRDSETPKNLAHMDDRIKNLTDQYKQLQARLDAVPKPTPVPDLAPIEAKVAQVGQLSQQIEAKVAQVGSSLSRSRRSARSSTPCPLSSWSPRRRSRNSTPSWMSSATSCRPLTVAHRQIGVGTARLSRPRKLSRRSTGPSNPE